MGEANHARNIESPKYIDTKYRGTAVYIINYNGWRAAGIVDAVKRTVVTQHI